MYRIARKAAASLTVAVLIVAGLAVTAVVRDEPQPPMGKGSVASVADPTGAEGAAAEDADERDREPFGASCRTAIEGSSVTAFCHNPYPATDRLQLHVECARWWDVDSDSAPVEAGPAGYVRLTGRCWKEIASAWVSHARAAP